MRSLLRPLPRLWARSTSRVWTFPTAEVPTVAMTTRPKDIDRRCTDGPSCVCTQIEYVFWTFSLCSILSSSVCYLSSIGFLFSSISTTFYFFVFFLVFILLGSFFLAVVFIVFDVRMIGRTSICDSCSYHSCIIVHGGIAEHRCFVKSTYVVPDVLGDNRTKSNDDDDRDCTIERGPFEKNNMLRNVVSYDCYHLSPVSITRIGTR